ncbi:sensor histidine kinase [Paenibacillus camelliae]|uniref:sensor histidine kinase n=1 Tax=Paenibacillus camelliae TaxID=512410 RepID=UPI00203ECA0D|nr:sensor histidine kinase [Paenibacillus camelliae]MCM3633725.1 sensor histidine kinase [Paenibacillus camelliae]
MKLIHRIKQNLHLDDIRLRNKFFMMYILCVFIPIILTNVIFYNLMSSNVQEQRMVDIKLSLDQVHLELERMIEAAVSVSWVFYTDYTLYSMLDAHYSNPADFVEAYDNYMRRVINSYTPVYTSVQNIKIYVDNPMVLHSGGVAFLSNKVRDTDWYKTLDLRTPSEAIFVKAYKEDSISSGRTEQFKDTFNIIRVMDYFDSLGTWDKVLKIELKTEAFDVILGNLNIPGSVYLVDPDGIIQYTTNRNINWREEQLAIDSLHTGSHTVVFEGEHYDMLPLQGWNIVAHVPESQIMHEAPEVRQYVLWIAITNILLATIIIVIISRSVTKRLGFLLRQMKRVKNGNFDIVNNRDALDEIGQVTSEFNRMTLQISSLINDVYVADIKEKNMELEHRYAQLNALQSQINPHFLFNALETIRMRSMMKNETETAKIIHNMAKIFRSSLTWKRDKVKLKEEVDFIVCFLEIQKYRFADRLDYSIELDPEAERCLVPKMIYLPFVENACIHGVEKVKQGGKVTISLKLVEDKLHFHIHDNGAGMNEEQVQRIYSYLEETKDLGERIGMQNVIYRLKLFYEDQFTFTVQSEQGVGTSIHLIIPVNH